MRRAALATLALAAAITGARGDDMALWRIAHDICVPAKQAGVARLPKPCLEANLQEGDVVIKDIRGVSQLLDIPTARVTGIEAPALLNADTPNYFADAWRARVEMTPLLKAAPARERISLAINSRDHRTQNQLHLHINCLKPEVAQTLAAEAPMLDRKWRRMNVKLAGRAYWAMRVDSADLEDVFPFRLLADEMPVAPADMGRWTLAAAAVEANGKPGFVLLADEEDAFGGGHAEDLQDIDCAGP